VYKALSPGAIGVRDLSLPSSIELAARTGFTGVSFDVREAAVLADLRGLAYVRDLFARREMGPAHWGLPVAWSEDRWLDDLRELPRFAALAGELGCDRCKTWMSSGSNTRAFRENFDWHAERYRAIAELLRAHECRFGIEFIGPRTFRAKFEHEFIHSLDGLIDLIAAIGTGNAGVLLDTWHVYTSGAPMADVGKLTARDVVLVHVNDAPGGVDRDEQIDSTRALPPETGVIDLAGFMGQLRGIGYDGPVVPEPFSKRVNDHAARDPREVAASMDTLWRVAELA